LLVQQASKPVSTHLGRKGEKRHDKKYITGHHDQYIERTARSNEREGLAVMLLAGAVTSLDLSKSVLQAAAVRLRREAEVMGRRRSKYVGVAWLTSFFVR